MSYVIDFAGISNVLHFCSIEKLFSIVCVNSISLQNLMLIEDYSDKYAIACDLAGMGLEAMIGFDTVAFIFIIFQLRIFNTWFFQRCMIEFRCELIQARRYYYYYTFCRYFLYLFEIFIKSSMYL